MTLIQPQGASPGSLRALWITGKQPAPVACVVANRAYRFATDEATMEITHEPEGFFITWTVYGTHLQGDARWWRKKGAGEQPPHPRLEQWHRDRLKHDVILLDKEHRRIVAAQIEAHCEHRGWRLWVANPRTNHVHVVVTAAGFDGKTVRDQLKANATGGLRRYDTRFFDRPVWTTRGDVQKLRTKEDLDAAILYAGEAQDRMDRGK